MTTTALSELSLAGGVLAGFASSLHCVGMCGPFAAASAKSVGWRGTTAYSGGRIVTYGVLGAVAGALGAMLSVLRVVGFVATAVVLFVVVLQLAGVLPEWKLPPSLSPRMFSAPRSRSFSATTGEMTSA